MFGQSKLEQALDGWTKSGGDLHEVLGPFRDQQLTSKAEAKAVCAALAALRAGSVAGSLTGIGSPLHDLTAFFQQVESDGALAVLRRDGLPQLRLWVEDLLAGMPAREDDVMFILKILAMYGEHEDVALIVAAARKPIQPDGYMWWTIMSQFNATHPWASEVVSALRDPLPEGFPRVAFLDMANSLAIEGALKRHPFDTDIGHEQLSAWLRSTEEEEFSRAHSATAALPFIAGAARQELLGVADRHPEPSVRVEAAWARARAGDAAGLDRLATFTGDARFSRTAQQYLEELGHAGMIPASARKPDFLALAEMAQWLEHPSEYGRAPDRLEVYDTRELYWPPTNDTRRLWLVEYTYEGRDGGGPDVGIGMVGSTTFALFGETTAELSPEDLYAIHCCWELQTHRDPRAPEERTAEVGRAILRGRNRGF